MVETQERPMTSDDTTGESSDLSVHVRHSSHVHGPHRTTSAGPPHDSADPHAMVEPAPIGGLPPLEGNTVSPPVSPPGQPDVFADPFATRSPAASSALTPKD